MITTFNGSEMIGELVAEFPGASNLMKKHKVDFCCGGDRVLSTVLEKQGIDIDTFLQNLNKLHLDTQDRLNREVDWRNAANSELIDHIVAKHHAYLNDELPTLGQFVTKVLRVHGADHAELAPLHKLFNELRSELEQHLIEEEEIVFPHIKEYEQNGSTAALEKACAAINKLESEHEHAGDLLKQIRAVTNDFSLPAGACRTYTLTYQKLEALESDMFQHVHLENNILFPKLLANI